jgi:hypothetical protein
MLRGPSALFGTEFCEIVEFGQVPQSITLKNRIPNGSVYRVCTTQARCRITTPHYRTHCSPPLPLSHPTPPSSEHTSEVCSEVYTEVCSEVCSEVYTEVYTEVCTEVCSEVYTEVYTEVCSEVYTEVCSEGGGVVTWRIQC